MNGTLLAWTERIERTSVAFRFASLVTLLGVVVLVDRSTGPDFRMTLPYALCVVLASWFLSRRWGVVTAIAAAVVAAIVDIVAERDEDWVVLIANHALALAAFVLFALLAAAVRRGVEELSESARRDPMTGALSRQGFLTALAIARRRAQRQELPIGVVYLDLDGLKQVNDEQGHAAGDALIRRFVERVTRHLRSTDVFGRLGGDEFAIVLERADADVIGAVVGRILEDPGLPDVSCGWQVFVGEYPEPERMLAGADRRMYAEKRTRRLRP